MPVNQKEATYNTVVKVLKITNILFKDGDDAKPLIKNIKDSILDLITEGLMSGDIFMSTEGKQKYNSRSLLKDYARSLLANSLKKDIRLNGGVKYTPTSSGNKRVKEPFIEDEQLRTLTQMRKLATNEDSIKSIDEAIKLRNEEINT